MFFSFQRKRKSELNLGLFRSNHQTRFIKEAVFKNFTKFWPEACNSIKKRDYGTGVFLWILWNFQEHLFYRTPPDDCFYLFSYCYYPLVSHCLKMSEYRFSLTRIFPYKDRIEDFVLIRENAGQKKLVFWYILRSVCLQMKTNLIN